jgi:hypothetical protein
VVRSPKAFYLYIIQNIFIIAFGCILYKNLSQDYSITNPKLLNNRIGSYFFLAMNAYFGVLSNTTFKMLDENKIVYKEIKARMYTVFDYFLAKSIADLIFLLLPIVPGIYPVRSPLTPAIQNVQDEPR